MNRKKNVAIFLNAFWNNGKGMSGGDQMLIQVFKRTRNEFNEIDFYTNIDGEKVVRDGGVENIKFYISEKIFDKLPIGINYVLRTLQSLKFLFNKKTEIIYGGSDFFPDVMPCFLYKIFYPKTKWVQCVFHIYPDWKNRPGNKVISFTAQYLQKISLFLIKRADTVVNINYQVKEELIKQGFDKSKIIVNTPGINLEYLRALRVDPETKKYQGSFLARLSPSKGIFDLPKIWKKVVNEFLEARLAIIGGGSDEVKKKLADVIKKNKLEKNIELLGFLSNDESFSIIKESEVFVFPSHEEGFGIAIAEAMACETPVVSWNLPVYKEIFEDNSVQVSENNFEEFSNKIIRILKNKEESEKLTKKASLFVEKYSWDSIAKKHKDIILNKKYDK